MKRGNFEKSWAGFQKEMEKRGNKKYKPMVLICEWEIEEDDDTESEFFGELTKPL
jgi:hypothetical protein